jgi:hypothetical protein
MVFLSLPMSQVCLLAAWAALGKTPAPWRAVGLILPLALWSYMIGTVLEPPDPAGSPSASTMTSQWTFFLLLEAAVAVALLGSARAAGLHVTGAVDRARTGNQPTPPRLQFSLRYLFAWLTAAAIALASLGYTFHLGSLALRAWDLRVMVVLAVVNVAVLLAALSALLTAWPRLLRWLIGLGASVVAIALLFSSPRDPGPGLLCGGVTVWVLASLAVVRVAGYRLAWRKRGLTAQSPFAPGPPGDGSFSRPAA